MKKLERFNLELTGAEVGWGRFLFQMDEEELEFSVTNLEGDSIGTMLLALYYLAGNEDGGAYCSAELKREDVVFPEEEREWIREHEPSFWTPEGPIICEMTTGARVHWSREDRELQWTLERNISAKPDGELKVSMGIREFGQKEIGEQNAYTFTTTVRDFAYILCRCCTRAMKRFGLYNLRIGTGRDDFDIGIYLWVKAFALRRERELYGQGSGEPFAAEMDILLQDM